ncbi:MAG: aminotransferase class I/II-fold pyridoxal phosphate-dependent enzyme [Clostridia bacterium]|nr:aminotransferase class I/II-fold pyridoxal phosphate-dependent enzyme [Clostridia bacterium]
MDYTKFLNARVANIKPSGIRKFFELVSEIPNAVSLGVGEPDFRTPYFIGERAIKSIKDGRTQYTSNNGKRELRELISEYLTVRFGIDYAPDEVLVTVGASEGIDLAMRAILETNDEVLIPEPSFVSYAPCVLLAGGVPVPIECREKDGFAVTPEAIERAATAKTKAILLSYPNNPTGAVMTKEQIEAIAPIIIKHDLLLLSDEIYAELTYGALHFSPASIPELRERCVYLNGFSKAFAMTGWRLGYLCAPKPIYEVMYKIHQYSVMCAPTMSQYAGIAALKQSLEDGFATICEMRDSYDKRRRYMVKALREIGLTCFEPKGAFYLFPYVGHLGVDGEAFAMGLLEKEKIVVVPGSAFGESGRDYVRISYAYSMQKLVTATEKIHKYLIENFS